MATGDVCVLVAEDDTHQREVLQELLEMLGFRSLAAATPAEVLTRLDARPEVVLLDLQGMATPLVRAALAGLASPPALVVASGDPDLAEEAASLGAKACLTKPFSVGQLLGALQSVLPTGRVMPTPA